MEWLDQRMNNQNKSKGKEEIKKQESSKVVKNTSEKVN